MLDHLTLHVKDIDRSITFYKQALAPLGYIVKAHHEPTLGFGVDDGTLHSDFYVSPIEGLEAEASPVTPVTHIAFLADSQQAVQAFDGGFIVTGGAFQACADDFGKIHYLRGVEDGRVGAQVGKHAPGQGMVADALCNVGAGQRHVFQSPHESPG